MSLAKGIFWLPAATLVFAIVACGGGDTTDPPIGTRVIEGEDGWLIAVPNKVSTDSEATIWIYPPEIGARTSLSFELRLPDGKIEGLGNLSIGKEVRQWVDAPLKVSPDQAGEYGVAVLDAQQRRLVEASILVVDSAQ